MPWAFDILDSEIRGVFTQFELIADPYRFPVLIADRMAGSKKTCLRCKRNIEEGDLHKIVIYVIQDRLSEHHYEHIECPGRFTV